MSKELLKKLLQTKFDASVRTELWSLVPCSTSPLQNGEMRTCDGVLMTKVISAWQYCSGITSHNQYHGVAIAKFQLGSN